MDQAPKPLTFCYTYSAQYPLTLPPIPGIGQDHDYDPKKNQKVYEDLRRKGLINSQNQLFPGEIDWTFFAQFYKPRYLEALGDDMRVFAKIVDVEKLGATQSLSRLPIPYFRDLPKHIYNGLVLPLLTAAQGTIVSAHAAMQRHCLVINGGGGFHHASANAKIEYCQGVGSERSTIAMRHDKTGQVAVAKNGCTIADISLAILSLRREHPDLKVLIIDLDVHHGDGHERDFFEDQNVRTIDLFTAGDGVRDPYIKKLVCQSPRHYIRTLPKGIGDVKYLAEVKTALDSAFPDFKPDIVFYNAGTDVLHFDAVQEWNITPLGVQDRNELVFNFLRKHNLPAVMTFAGGYGPLDWTAVVSSLAPLARKGIIQPFQIPHPQRERG